MGHAFHPWPGHPCHGHNCDGCAICQAGGCCGNPTASLTVPATTDSLANWRVALDRLVTQGGTPAHLGLTTRPLASLVGATTSAASLPVGTTLRPSPLFASPRQGVAA